MMFVLSQVPAPFLAGPSMTINQSTSGWCSPTILNVIGNVYLTCIGVDPRALVALNEKLKTEKLKGEAALAFADEWAQKYRDLDRRLGSLADEPKLMRRVQQYLHSGRLDEAQHILEQMIGAEEKQTEKLASHYFDLASIHALSFREQESFVCIERAYRYRPEDMIYSQAYSQSLLNRAQFLEAESVLQHFLSRAHTISVTRHLRSNLFEAVALEQLALVYWNTGRLTHALEAEGDAIEILRWSSSKPSPNLVGKLSIDLSYLATMYSESKELEASEKASVEAIGLSLGLLTKDPEEYLPLFANNLDKLTTTLQLEGKWNDAIENEKSALFLYTKLEKQRGRGRFLHAIAQCQSSLGGLYFHLGRLDEAAGSIDAAFLIRLKLASSSSPLSQSELADTLLDAGMILTARGRTHEAGVMYRRAVILSRELTETQPSAFSHLYARALIGVGVIELNDKDYMQASNDLSEGVSILQQNVYVHPNASRDDLGKGLDALGFTYMQQGKFVESKRTYTALLPMLKELKQNDAVTWDPYIAKTENVLAILELKLTQGSESGPN